VKIEPVLAADFRRNAPDCSVFQKKVNGIALCDSMPLQSLSLTVVNPSDFLHVLLLLLQACLSKAPSFLFILD